MKSFIPAAQNQKLTSHLSPLEEQFLIIDMVKGKFPFCTRCWIPASVAWVLCRLAECLKGGCAWGGLLGRVAYCLKDRYSNGEYKVKAVKILLANVHSLYIAPVKPHHLKKIFQTCGRKSEKVYSEVLHAIFTYKPVHFCSYACFMLNV